MIYEDYFKSVIGGNFASPEYYNTTYDNRSYEPVLVNTTLDYNHQEEEILNLYPDIYKVVMPMIDKMLIGKDITNLNDKDLQIWTLEIYDALEADDDIKNEIKPRNQIYESETTNAKVINRTNNTKVSNNIVKTGNNTNVLENTKIDKTLEVANRYTNRNNPLLRDLIRIMILNRLFGNNRPQRPPYPGFGMPNNRPNPNLRPANASPYSRYLKNTPKTYFDVPYPEEGK